ncbi:MAG: SpoIIE family protein phosphatase [Krumholzibacteria bacterium]|nr:SpoIIE family protein phosphatase [Candidatus Krumholzibacteria bacterium]
MVSTCKPFVTDLVEEVGSLPSAAAAIVAMTVDPECSLDGLARALKADAAMALRFLALANSAALSRGQEVRDLKAALVRLGIRRVRNVALLMGTRDMMPSGAPSGGLDPAAFWRYCLATASCAQGLAWQRGRPALEDAWLVGLLHGIGVAALARRAGDGLAEALGLARHEGLSLAAAERRVLGFDHGELGGRILAAWQLPAPYAAAVAQHAADGTAETGDRETAELVEVLRTAIAVVRAAGYGDGGDRDPRPTVAAVQATTGLDDGALEALAGKVETELQEMARFLEIDLGGERFQAALAAARNQLARLGLEGIDQAMAREGLEEQLTVARAIQRRLLPSTMPALPHWEIAAVNQASSHVSGDIFDVVGLPGERTGLLVADVAGKGLPAALLATSLQATVRALAMVYADPGRLLAAVNEALFALTDDEHFATVFLAVLHPDGSGFRYASAGHVPPLLLRADGTAQWLRPAGTPVGLVPGASYPVQEVAMVPGDTLLAVTDGVTEAPDGAGSEFGSPGLEQAARRCAGAPIDAVTTAVTAAVLDHLGSGRRTRRPAEPADDLTLLVLRRRP